MTQPLQLFLAIGLIIAAAKTAGYVVQMLDQPAVLGELLAGVLLGPTILDLFGQVSLFPNGHDIAHIVVEVAEIGVLLLIFTAGLEVDIDSMLAVGRPAVLTGLMGVIVPMIMLIPAAMLFDYSLEKAIFIGLVLASMSTAISAQVMLELGVLQRREGLTLLGAALVDDLLLILCVSIFLAVNPGGVAQLAESRPILEVVVRMVGFLVIGTAACWILLPKIANRVSRMSISESPLVVALVATLLMGVAAEYLGGIAAIAGAFIAGVSLRRANRGVVEQMERSLHALNYGLLVPMFFISIGLKANLRLLDSETIPFTIVMLILAVISKVVGSWAGSRAGGLDNLSATRVGIGMISRGEVGLILATIGINAGILENSAFSVLVLIVLVTTLITPPLIRWSYTERAVKLFSTAPQPEPDLAA